MLVPSCGRSDHPAAPGVVIRGVGVGGTKEVEKVLTVQGVVPWSIIDLPLSPTCGESQARSDKTDCATASGVWAQARMRCDQNVRDLGESASESESDSEKEQGKKRNVVWQVRLTLDVWR